MITRRLSRDPADLARAINLVRAHPGGHEYVVDLPYRLVSTGLDDGSGLLLCEQGGELLAWAMFQPAWYNTDLGLHPSVRGSELVGELIAWGHAQALEYAGRSGETFLASVEVPSGQPELFAELERQGYAPFDWGTVHLERSLEGVIPGVRLPDGYTVRPLRQDADLPAVVALQHAAFGSNRMTLPWRSRLPALPDYRADLDVVIVAPAGHLAAFALGWLAAPEDGTGRLIGQIEPLGVHPDQHERGLGRALETALLGRFRALGATVARVNHASFNAAALRLSETAGFRRVGTSARYFRAVG